MLTPGEKEQIRRLERELEVKNHVISELADRVAKLEALLRLVRRQ